MGASLSSMTGFARLDGAHEGWRWTWELKSVNGRGLELRCRVPQGFDNLEQELRKAAKEKLNRGSINASLTMHSDTGDARYRINEAALGDAITMVEKVNARLNCAPPRAEGILSLRGVIEPADDVEDEDARKALSAAVLDSFAAAIDVLARGRKSEGAAMSAVLSGQLDDIEQLTVDASKLAATAPQAIMKRIQTQLDELMINGNLPEERLAQEAALLALKADIREELDRLTSHVAAGRALLEENGPAGRQLDFLTQEFNREANTLCSKVPDMELKRIGLQLKKVIDQMREQVQNIE